MSDWRARGTVELEWGMRVPFDVGDRWQDWPRPLRKAAGDAIARGIALLRENWPAAQIVCDVSVCTLGPTAADDAFRVYRCVTLSPAWT